MSREQPPETRRQRYQAPIIASIGALSSLPKTLTNTSLAIYVRRLGATSFEVSLIFAATRLGTLLFAPLWGAVGDTTGRRRTVLFLTGGLASLAMLGLAVAATTYELLAARWVHAVFYAGMMPITLTIVSARGGSEGRGRAIGGFSSFRSMGFAAGQLIAGVAVSVATSTELFAVLAAINAATAVLALLLVDPTRVRDAAADLSAIAAGVRRRVFPPVGERDRLTTKGLHYVYASRILLSMTFIGLLSQLPVYLTEEIGISEALMGAFLASNPASRSVLMYVFGRVVDRVGRKPVLVGGAAGYGLFAVLLTAVTVPATPAYRLVVLAVAFLVVATSISASAVGVRTFIGDVAAVEHESGLRGFSATAAAVGGSVGPLLVGGVVTLVSYDVAFLLAGGFGVLAAGLLAVGVTEPA